MVRSGRGPWAFRAWRPLSPGAGCPTLPEAAPTWRGGKRQRIDSALALLPLLVCRGLLPPAPTLARRSRWAMGVLSLLAGAVLLPPAPAQAQTTTTFWSATLTPGQDGNKFGCDNVGSSLVNCSQSAVLTDDDFEFDSVTHNFRSIEINQRKNDPSNLLQLDIRGRSPLPAAVVSHGSLVIDGKDSGGQSFTLTFPLSQGSHYGWTSGSSLEWDLLTYLTNAQTDQFPSFPFIAGKEVQLSLTIPTRPPAPTVNVVTLLGSRIGTVTLRWNRVPGTTSYEYQQKELTTGACGTSNYGTWTNAGTGTTLVKSGLTPGNRYCFRVRAVRAMTPPLPGPVSSPVAGTAIAYTIKLIHTYDPINGRDATVEGHRCPWWCRPRSVHHWWVATV